MTIRIEKLRSVWNQWHWQEFGRSLHHVSWLEISKKSDEPSQKKDFIKNYENPELQKAGRDVCLTLIAVTATFAAGPSAASLDSPPHGRTQTHNEEFSSLVRCCEGIKTILTNVCWFAMMCFLLPSFVEVVLQWCFYIMRLVASFLSYWYLVDCWGFCNANRLKLWFFSLRNLQTRQRKTIENPHPPAFKRLSMALVNASALRVRFS